MAKTYINGMNCKAISGQFWEFFNISINFEKLQQYVNDKGYINITMSKRREVGQYWDTHYFVLNEYNPENNTIDNAENITKDNKTDEISVEDIPF